MTAQEALKAALDRMDRARNLLTNGKPTPECNWGMLDTSDIRAALSQQAAQEPQPIGEVKDNPDDLGTYVDWYGDVPDVGAKLYTAAPAKPVATVPDGAAWTRHGNGDTEWWSYGDWRAKKSCGLWKLTHQGRCVYQHEYLQEVMSAASAKPADPLQFLADQAQELDMGYGKPAKQEKAYGFDDFMRDAKETNLTIHDILPQVIERCAEIEAEQQAPSTAARGIEKDAAIDSALAHNEGAQGDRA